MKVGDEYRTNPLSHRPGGVTVRICFQSGQCFDYDKVKHPEAFIRKSRELDPTIVSAEIINHGEKQDT